MAELKWGDHAPRTGMDPELKLRVEWAEAEDAFLAAKKNRAKDPEAYATAKAELHELRTYWRQIREALAPVEGVTVVEDADGVVVTKTVVGKVGSN